MSSSSSASNAYYDADIETFIGTTSDAILGRITANNAFAVDPEQRDAWLTEIKVLKHALAGVEGTIFLEFNVPRIGSRIDAVLISGPAIFAIEFKVGETRFKRDDLNQVWDYALDLKNFHKASHHAPIIPMLVATRALRSETVLPAPHDDHVFPPVRCNSEGLRYLKASSPCLSRLICPSERPICLAASNSLGLNSGDAVDDSLAQGALWGGVAVY